MGGWEKNKKSFRENIFFMEQSGSQKTTSLIKAWIYTWWYAGFPLCIRKKKKKYHLKELINW